MIVEILATGNELLSGALVDSNSAYIAEKIGEIGMMAARHTLVGDDEKELEAIFIELSNRADIIIVTGGLGPTQDDLSREIAARSAGVELKLDQASLDRIEEFFNTRGRKAPKNNRIQAHFPVGAEILENPVGTAPGFALKINRGTFFFMPGVPGEMRRMLKDQVIPRIVRMNRDINCYECKTISTFGLGESALEEKLDGFSEKFPAIDLGFRASFPEVQIKLYQKNSSKEELLKEQREASKWLKERLGEKIISMDGASLAAVIGDLLIEKKVTLAVAESCTGGLIANLLTDRAGSSAYFILSAVTYADSAKQKLLGVDPEILRQYGAVHEETAKAMAVGAREAAGATFALATTGIAGPTGGSPEKPVGTVCIGLAGPDEVSAKRYHFSFGRRRYNKTIFAAQALNLLRRKLLSI